MDHTERWTVNHKTPELIVGLCPKPEGLTIQRNLRARSWVNVTIKFGRLDEDSEPLMKRHRCFVRQAMDGQRQSR